MFRHQYTQEIVSKMKPTAGNLKKATATFEYQSTRPELGLNVTKPRPPFADHLNNQSKRQ